MSRTAHLPEPPTLPHDPVSLEPGPALVPPQAALEPPPRGPSERPRSPAHSLEPRARSSMTSLEPRGRTSTTSLEPRPRSTTTSLEPKGRTSTTLLEPGTARPRTSLEPSRPKVSFEPGSRNRVTPRPAAPHRSLDPGRGSDPGARGSEAAAKSREVSLRPTVDELVELFEPLVRSKSAELPVLPGIAMEALRLVRDPRVKVDALLRVVEEDPPLAARILAVANSTFYARGIPIRSLRQAVVRLGLAPLRDVIYMAIYANTVFDAPGFVELVRETFDHCVKVGRIAQRLAPILGHDEETAFLAGLLHDVGQARCFKLFAKHPQARNCPREVLSEAADRLHEAAGATLARAWNLPDEVVDACEHHHVAETRFAKLIHAADAVSHELARHPAASMSSPRMVGLEPTAALALVDAGLDERDVAEVLEGLVRELGGVSILPS